MLVYMLLVALSVPALRVGTLRMQQSEDAAKAAWLARTAADAPSWGPKGGTPVAAAPAAPPAAAAPATTEEEAKAAWLARVAADAPSWGASAGAAPAMTEEAAKAAWLARLDAPSWGQASTTMSEVAGQASALLALTEDCDSGVEAACDTLSREEEAKRAWLARSPLVSTRSGAAGWEAAGAHSALHRTPLPFASALPSALPPRKPGARSHCTSRPLLPSASTSRHGARPPPPSRRSPPR